MKTTFYKKHENCILALGVVLLNVVIMAVCFDFYYDLNDDTLMKDIMAGIYSQTPEGRNMQTLYILGAVIGLGYRLCGEIPWYGLFLCLCQSGCFFLVGKRLAGFFEKLSGKLAALAGLSLLQWGVMLPHLVNIQYTITCAILSATAIYLFLTTEENLTTAQFLRKNMPSIVLVVLAYQLRTEMLLLTLPFVGLAGLCRWSFEKPVFTRQNWQKYGIVIGAILAGMLLSRGLDSWAYGSESWKDFRQYFDARTTVYDFYPEVITQDSYGADLEELGITPQQQTLLRNYNFGLDDKIDTQLLTRVADYATETVGAARDWKAIFRQQLWRYGYRTFHSDDAPYNLLVLLAYALLVYLGIRRRPALLWQTVLLATGRSLIWMYILMRGRDPERITHSLYLVEFALQSALVCMTLQKERAKDGILRGFETLFLLVLCLSVGNQITTVRQNQAWREQTNGNRSDIDSYCKGHKENYYLEDVYSTVSFSERIFDGNGAEFTNYDMLGGWICKSPLYEQKLAAYGITSVAEALIQKDNVLLIMSNVEAAEQGFDWLTAYYAAENIPVSVEQEDVINENYSVYRIVSQNGKK